MYTYAKIENKTMKIWQRLARNETNEIWIILKSIGHGKRVQKFWKYIIKLIFFYVFSSALFLSPYRSCRLKFEFRKFDDRKRKYNN